MSGPATGGGGSARDLHESMGERAPCIGAFGCGHPISEHASRHGCTRYPCECEFTTEDFHAAPEPRALGRED
jgi:hypothetical protein